MDAAIPPPVLSECRTPAPPPLDPPPARLWRRAGMLAVLLGMVILPLALPWMLRLSTVDSPGETALPGTVGGLLAVVGENLVASGVLLGLAFVVGRPRRSELWMRRESSWVAAAFGAGWSIALRALLMVIVGIVVGVVMLRSGGKGADAVLEHLKPKVENLLPFAALRDPLYVALLATVVSFILAALREELWRAGMLAALCSLLPRQWSTRQRQWTALGLTSVAFGAAHVTLGAAGMVEAGILGVGLGAIMLAHRSFWTAFWAHGFFDATTFLALWLVVKLNLLQSLTG